MGDLSIGNTTLTPKEARAFLPDVVAFVKHNGLLDPYVEQITKRIDPAHEHAWLLLDTSYDHDRGKYFIKLRCTECGDPLHLDLAHHYQTDSDIYELAVDVTGLDRYVLHDRYMAFCKKMIEIFEGGLNEPVH